MFWSFVLKQTLFVSVIVLILDTVQLVKDVGKETEVYVFTVFKIK